jgi:hypothetical protein
MFKSVASSSSVFLDQPVPTQAEDFPSNQVVRQDNKRMKIWMIALLVLCSLITACDRRSDGSRGSTTANSQAQNDYDDQVKRQQAQLDDYDKQSRHAEEQLKAQAAMQKRADDMLQAQEDMHKRADALLVSQEQLLKRQQDDFARFEKILETWERHQTQYQKYLDSLEKK